jgi:hypothetical protein
MVSSGGALIFNRTRPQRQPPSMGKFFAVIITLPFRHLI